MAFTALAFFGGTSPVDAFSTPHRVSLCVNDSNGGGGNILINGLGINDPAVSGALDLKTFFGANFKSSQLLTAFRALVQANANLAEQQLVTEVQVIVVSASGVPAKQPSMNYLGMAVGGVNVPFLSVVSPAVVGAWRVDLQFRHSLIY